MRAYPLDEPRQAIGAEELATHGVLSWRVPPDDAARAETIAAIKRDHGYVDEDFIELGPATPNLEAICAKFDKEHFHTEDEVRFVRSEEHTSELQSRLHL